MERFKLYRLIRFVLGTQQYSKHLGSELRLHVAGIDVNTMGSYRRLFCLLYTHIVTVVVAVVLFLMPFAQ